MFFLEVEIPKAPIDITCKQFSLDFNDNIKMKKSIGGEGAAWYAKT